MTDFSRKWLVETEWLAGRLRAPDIAVLDASLLSGGPRHARQEFLQDHIPGALFFDIDDLSDTSNPMPHMLPPPEKFASRMKKMGIGDGMRVVVYDRLGLYSAPRAWWMFRVMGHQDVAVLNGGLPKWKAEGRPLESGEPIKRSERHFTARKNAGLVRDLYDMQGMLKNGAMQIVDARAAARFEGADPELRHVPRLGHIPGSRNVPFASLLNPDKTLKAAEEIRALFQKAGVDPAKPVTATCGTGITACTLALGLAVIGQQHAAVYDGSWFEWSNAPDAPVETGAARA